MTPTLTRTEDEPLIPPYGNELKTLLVESTEAQELRKYAESLPSICLTTRAAYDLELLSTGAFSPLDRFMSSFDYQRVLEEMRLQSGHIFPIPITLPIENGHSVKPNREITLRDSRNNPLAVMQVEEIYEWNRPEYERKVLGTESIRHPLVTELGSWGDRFISGPLRVISTPQYYDFP